MQPTLRRGTHFNDTPTRLIPFDLDGVKIAWMDDPERAIRTILMILGEPWALASCVWFFTTKHGLELDGHGRWTGRIIDGEMRIRLMFITDRALNRDESKALTAIAHARIPAVDMRMCDAVHVNYIRRPLLLAYPGRDVLGDMQTIGRIEGAHDVLAVPDTLTHTAHWEKAQGLNSIIADHPDAESAVRSICSDGHIYRHMTSAAFHLLRTNPPPDVISNIDHSQNIMARLQSMIEQQREEINDNLSRYFRTWNEFGKKLSDTERYVLWWLDNPGALRASVLTHL